MEEEALEVVALVLEVGVDEEDTEGSKMGEVTVATGLTRRMLKLIVQTE